MRISPTLSLLASLLLTSTLSAQTTIENFGFEQDWEAWKDIDPDGADTEISENFHNGSKSAKITGEKGRFEQVIQVEPQTEYELKAYIKGPGVVGLSISGRTFTTSSSGNTDKWTPVSLPFSTEDATEAIIFGAYNGGEGRFDDFELLILRSKSEGVIEGDSQDSLVLDDPVVRILGSDLSSELSYILKDIAAVTSEENDLRVLSISGDGSFNNINDLLYLPGIDAAVVQADALSNFREESAVRNLENKLAYIAQLGSTVSHMLARKSIPTIQKLEGKRVYMGEQGSGAYITASNIFDRLGIEVNAVSDIDHQEALADVKAGELDAVFWMEVPPVDLLNLITPSDEVHLLHIPTQSIDSDLYDIRTLTTDDYAIIPAEEPIQTAAVPIALIAYNWPSGHHRYAKMKRFSEILAMKTEALQNGDYHRSLRNADFFSEVGEGWQFFE